MPLHEDVVSQLADQLDVAERSGKQLDQFSLAHSSMTIEDGYAIQRAWVAKKLANGRRLIGHKIGLTSRAMQRSSNIAEPDYGALLDDMIFTTGSEIPPGRFIEPRVEVELAFVLQNSLSGPNCTLDDVLHATEYVVPALEIIDARIRRIDPASGKTRKVFDTISDNAANAGIVLGECQIDHRETDLRWISALIFKNDVIEDSGVAAAVLGHPALGIAWLANKLAPWGETLQPGEIVLAGSFTAPVLALPGDAFRVDYHKFGTVAVNFAPAR